MRHAVLHRVGQVAVQGRDVARHQRVPQAGVVRLEERRRQVQAEQRQRVQAGIHNGLIGQRVAVHLARQRVRP